MKMKNAQILNDNRDFLRLYRKGQCQVSPLLVTYARRNGKKDKRRVGITATKKVVGGAVQRNRAKRLIRAAWREAENNAPYGWDYIFVARGRTTKAKMQQIKAAMADQLRRATAPQKEKEPKQQKRNHEEQ